jgi:hypothetical protein
MIGRLLIDECLSPELAQLAIEAGHVEATSVRDRGRLGLQDWEFPRRSSVSEKVKKRPVFANSRDCLRAISVAE